MRENQPPEYDLKSKEYENMHFEEKRALTSLLSSLLSHTFTMALKTFKRSEDIKGMTYYSIYSILKNQYDEMIYAINEISMKIKTLGYNTPENLGSVAKLSEVEDIIDEKSILSLVNDIIKENQYILTFLNEQLPLASKFDSATQNLIERRIIIHEKNIWMLQIISDTLHSRLKVLH